MNTQRELAMLVDLMRYRDACAFLVMNFKQRFNRPRPSQLLPELMPQMAVPGHAAYPSGHATVAHLIALCLESVLPTNHRARALLRPLADRIAINREVMGPHY